LTRQTVYPIKDDPAGRRGCFGCLGAVRVRPCAVSGLSRATMMSLLCTDRPHIVRSNDFKSACKAAARSGYLSLPEPHECWLPLISGCRSSSTKTLLAWSGAYRDHECIQHVQPTYWPLRNILAILGRPWGRYPRGGGCTDFRCLDPAGSLGHSGLCGPGPHRVLACRPEAALALALLATPLIIIGHCPSVFQVQRGWCPARPLPLQWVCLQRGPLSGRVPTPFQQGDFKKSANGPKLKPPISSSVARQRVWAKSVSLSVMTKPLNNDIMSKVSNRIRGGYAPPFAVLEAPKRPLSWAQGFRA
jgi:hypothetical protein